MSDGAVMATHWCFLTLTCICTHATPQVDVEALNAQVEEKKQRKAAEQAVEQ
jgi:hypothetical protein